MTKVLVNITEGNWVRDLVDFYLFNLYYNYLQKEISELHRKFIENLISEL